MIGVSQLNTQRPFPWEGGSWMWVCCGSVLIQVPWTKLRQGMIEVENCAVQWNRKRKELLVVMFVSQSTGPMQHFRVEPFRPNTLTSQRHIVERIRSIRRSRLVCNGTTLYRTPPVVATDGCHALYRFSIPVFCEKLIRYKVNLF